MKKALKKEKGYDLLITIAAPHSIHWGAAFSWIKTQTANRWIADCGDPFMGVTTDTFKPPFYFKYLEKYWCRKCDYIAVPFEGAKAGYYKEFHNKIKIIPQGFDFSEIKIERDFKKNGIPTFAYAGGFIPGVRDPKPFVEYLLSLQCDFKFIIFTRSAEILEPVIQKARGKIVIKNFIPRPELLNELSKMDFLINFTNGNTTQLPSKLIDYYITGRPILSLDSYDFNKTIAQEFIKGNYRGQLKIINPEQYRIENVAKKFLEN
ncbi:MAG: hypothetical protein R2821_08460 [Flavobacteriaceae bacterium]